MTRNDFFLFKVLKGSIKEGNGQNAPFSKICRSNIMMTEHVLNGNFSTVNIQGIPLYMGKLSESENNKIGAYFQYNRK